MNITYDTDLLMKELWVNLARDFRSWTYPTFMLRQERELRTGGIKAFRQVSFPDKFNAPVYIFKAQYQLENLFKRYRFRDDQFTQEELERSTIEKFLDVQNRISAPIETTPLVDRVLERARDYMCSCLGEFSQAELVEACRFGKKATKGNPFSDSYADIKLGSELTGSTEQIKWFREVYLPDDKLLQDTLVQCSPSGVPNYVVCDTLNATLVPKSYKALRLILPNTLIGTLRSYGLGKMIEVRLRKYFGLDIRRLQAIHGQLIKEMSKTRKSVTGDLSSASDSPNMDLMSKVLPESWFKELNLGRITKVKAGDTVYDLNSFMTMGIGFTFPLETLLFYSLLRSIADLAKVKGRISVYGDDLIYPRDMHRYVAFIFPKLHIMLNNDKTYVNTYFRESCGSDAFHGSDVRPFQPEGQASTLSQKRYTMLLYKTVNGLLHRWSPLEIPGTIRFLLAEILLVDGLILQVPPCFPEEAGFRTSSIIRDYGFAPVVYDRPRSAYRFAFYRQISRDRVVLHQIPYFWESLMLRGNEQSEDTGDVPNRRWYGNQHYRDFLRRCTDPLELLHWTEATCPPFSVRSKLTRKRYKRLVAVVAHKSVTRIKRCKGSESIWA